MVFRTLICEGKFDLAIYLFIYFILGKKLPSGFPVITKNMPPYDQFTKQYVGTNITLNCAGSGHGKVEVRWLMDFQPFEKIKTSWKEGEGFDYLLKNNNTTLKIYNLKLLKRSFIVCFIHNDIGIREVGRFNIHGVPAPSRRLVLFLFFQ